MPARYQEELAAAVGALAASIPCTLPPPTVPDAVEEDEDRDDEDDDDEDEGKKKDDDKGKGKGERKGKRG